MGRKHHRRKSSDANKKKSVDRYAAETLPATLEEEKAVNSPYYEIKHSEIMGRYLIAKRRLPAGTAIIENVSPLVVGPCQNTVYKAPICLGCYRTILAKQPCRCAGCYFPICGQDCTGMHTEYGHSAEECQILSSVPPQQIQILLDKIASGIHEQQVVTYNPFVPLRCLLLKKHRPDKWQDLVRLEHHNEIRRNNWGLWISNQKSVVDVIINLWQIKEFTEEEIHTVCGYLEVNAFSIGQRGINVRGLYGDNISMMCHDCVPNTTHIDGDAYAMTVRTTTAIDKGQPITMTYASTLQGTAKRRKHLRESKFFDCVCQRCSEPGELDTFMSGIRCGACRPKGKSPGNYLLPVDPLNEDSLWKCLTPSCSQSMTSRQVDTLLNRIESELGKIKGENVDEYEDFLSKYEGVLHPNHYLMVGAKYPLSQMYGKIDGYLIHQLTQQQLARKLEICRQLMAVFNVIEPGLARIRGITLYELHAPLLMLSTSQYGGGLITRQELKAQLREVVTSLKESVRILGFEPPSTQEGSTATAAREALQATAQWQALIGKV